MTDMNTYKNIFFTTGVERVKIMSSLSFSRVVRAQAIPSSRQRHKSVQPGDYVLQNYIIYIYIHTMREKKVLLGN